MPYAAQSDLLQRMSLAELAQLTSDTRDGQVDATIVANALADASGVIEGACRGRYACPLQPSAELTRLCRDVAAYLLYQRRPQKINDGIRMWYTDAMAILNAIRDGKQQLDQPTGDLPQTPLGGPAVPRRTGLRFTERDIEGFV